jgi:hypothetical protein
VTEPPRHAPRASRALPGALVAAALVAVALAPPAARAAEDEGASTEAAPDAGVRVSVRAVTTVVGAAVGSDTFRLRLLVENTTDEPIDRLDVRLDVHPPVADRAALEAALDGTLTTSPSRSVRRATGPGALGPGVARLVEADIVVSAPVGADREGGVHPVRVRLISPDGDVATLTTAVVRLDVVPTDPLPASVVVPFDDGPWRGPAGTYARGVAAATRDGGRLEDLLRALERHPGARIVLAPGAHLVEDLADRADGFILLESPRTDPGTSDPTLVRIDADDPAALTSSRMLARLRTLATSLPLAPVTGPYAAADLDALMRGGAALTDLAARAAIDGPRVVRRTLGVRVELTTRLEAAPEPEVLDLLGGTVVLLPADALARDEGTQGTVTGTVRTPAGALVSVLVADAAIARALTRAGDAPGGPLLAAHDALVLSAASALAPTGGRAGGEGTLLVMPPTDWDPGLVLADAFLAGLASAPWLALEGPEAMVARARRDTLDVTLVAPTPDPFTPTLRDALRDAALAVRALERALPPGIDTVDGRGLSALEDDLVRATSRRTRDPEDRSARALVDGVLATTAAAFGTIDIGAQDVTLTARDGVVPVTVTRAAGVPILVRVTMSRPGRLQWTDGPTSDPVLLEPGVAQTVSFRVSARSTGDVPVIVTVTDPGGERVLGSATFSVRATAASRPALALIGATIVALLAVGAVRDRRRRERERATPDATPAAGA